MRSSLASHSALAISEIVNASALRADQPKARPMHRIAFPHRVPEEFIWPKNRAHVARWSRTSSALLR
jgi:hypothetical protein